MNITQKKPDFEKVLDQLMAELSKLRTGRANPAMIEDVRVDYYGTPTPVKQLANITVPHLTEERRRELLKIVGKEAEEAKIRIRGIREDILKELKKQQESNQISEDEKFRLQDALQKMVDEFNAKIKEIAESKEKDMMTI